MRIKINSVLVCSCSISGLDSPMAGCGEKVEGKASKEENRKEKGEGGRIVRFKKRKKVFIQIFFYLLHMNRSASSRNSRAGFTW